MQRNTVRRSLGIAGVLALGSIVIAYAQQQPAPVAPVTGQWPDVDCATAKLTTTASQPRCQRGPVFNPSGRDTSGRFDCADEEWNVTARSPTNFGFALLYNIPALVPTCAVTYPGGIAKALKGYSPFPTNGTGWSEVSQIGDIYTARFTSAGGENCRAFAKFGPPWQQGFVWEVRGWLCGARGNSVPDRDLQSFVDALIIKVP